MFHGPVRKHTDAASTVTDLISDLDTRKASWHDSRHRSSASKSNANECRSSTKVLRNYIREYDRSQAKNLAEALTCQVYLNAELNENKEIDKEISYAKDLLGQSSQAFLEEDLRSLTTDDLLAMGPIEEVQSDFQRTPVDFAPSPFDSHKDCVIETVPLGQQKILTSSKKPESSSSMRFSEIASANFFSRTLSDTSSSDSNLFSLNGVNYTPHSVKYKALFVDSRTSKISKVSQCDKSASRVTFSDSSFDNSHGTITASPERLTAHAGRTPYKYHNFCERSSDSSDETLENTKDCAGDGTSQSEFSSGHYSVPINFKGEIPAVRKFMQTCLEEDDCEVDKGTTASGSVETLKNMLFTLQSINSSDSFACTQEVDDHGGPASLKKALSHLSNLKDLLA